MTLPILQSMTFGSVDSESEPNLDKKFIKTSYFVDTLLPAKNVIIGAKGSGKSALFEILTKHESEARILSGGALKNTIIIAGTGLGDLDILTADDLETLTKEESADFTKIWTLYIAVKVAIRLSQEGMDTQGKLREFLRSIGKIRDYRILPIVQEFWRAIVGPKPTKITVKNPAFGEVSLDIGKETFDTRELLFELNSALATNRKQVLIVFDKIDELFPGLPARRKQAIEGLFQSLIANTRAYPNIRIKILVRTDIWNQLQFTNKSHLTDKLSEINWDEKQIVKLINKRALLSLPFRELVIDRYPNYSNNLNSIDFASDKVNEDIFYMIFSKKIYPGSKEAPTLNWMTERLRDGTRNFFPREFIILCNRALENQKDKIQAGGDDIEVGESLIDGKSILDAFLYVSGTRKNTYLSEFSHLAQHFDRFKEQVVASYNKEQLLDLMHGLHPTGDELINELTSVVGLLEPIGGPSPQTRKFEIPRLYRTGLGLSIPGRP